MLLPFISFAINVSLASNCPDFSGTYELQHAAECRGFSDARGAVFYGDFGGLEGGIWVGGHITVSQTGCESLDVQFDGGTSSLISFIAKSEDSYPPIRHVERAIWGRDSFEMKERWDESYNSGLMSGAEAEHIARHWVIRLNRSGDLELSTWRFQYGRIYFIPQIGFERKSCRLRKL